MNRVKGVLKAAVEYIERKTLQAHFRVVESELRSSATADLTPDRRKARSRILALLTEYRERGLFPRNTLYKEARAPYLRDHRGTSCAMAYLMEETGMKSLVDALACKNNNIYMEDADDPALSAWLEGSGLTQEEAARIQPGYPPGGFGHGDFGVNAIPVSRIAPLPLPPAADDTWLILLGAICAGAAVWFAVRWLHSRRHIKQPLPPDVRPTRRVPPPPARIPEREPVPAAREDRGKVLAGSAPGR